MSATLEQCLEAERLRAERESARDHCSCWHIVLDDPNWEDRHVRYCAKDAGGEGCVSPDLCMALVPILTAMSRTQRRKLAARGYRR